MNETQIPNENKYQHEIWNIKYENESRKTRKKRMNCRWKDVNPMNPRRGLTPWFIGDVTAERLTALTRLTCRLTGRPTVTRFYSWRPIQRHFISFRGNELKPTSHKLPPMNPPQNEENPPSHKERNSEIQRERERERSPFHWIIHTHKYINRYIQQIVMKTSWDREIVALFFSYFSWNPIENQKKPRRPLLLLLLLLCRLVWQHC